MQGPGRGQSEIVGTLFLTAVVIALVTAVGFAFIGNLEETDSPSIDIVPAANENEVRLSHNGGSDVNQSTVMVHLEGSQGWTDEFRLNETTVNGDGDDQYDPGETAVRAHAISGGWVDVMVVHEPTGRVLLRATEDIRERTPVPGTPSVQFTPTGPTPTATPVPTPSQTDPTASFTHSPLAPLPGEQVSFDASGSSDPDGTITAYEWDWTSDGTFEGTGETSTHSYGTAGTYTVTLRVTDDGGNQDTTTGTVSIGEGWTLFQVDAQNRGNGTNTGPTASLSQEWSTSTDEFDSSGAVADAGAVYAGDKSGTVYAFNPEDGSTIWTYSGSGEVKGSLALGDETVFVPTKGPGRVIGIYAANGTERWSYGDIKDIDRGSVTVDGGVLYVGDDKGQVHAVYTANGTRKWVVEIGEEVKSTPAVRDGTVYVANKKEGTLYALDAADGGDQWSFETEDEFEFASPVTTATSVYIADKTGVVYAVDRSTGTETWRKQLPGDTEVKSALTVVDDTLYVPEKKTRTLYALNATTGNEVWTYETTGEIEFSSPVAASGVLYLTDKASTVYALSAGSGTELDTYDVGGDIELKSPPIVVDGTIYVGGKEKENSSFFAIGGAVTPVADFRYTPHSPVEEEVVTFDASWSTDPDSSITGYEWDFDDDGLFEQTGRTGIHEFDDPGTHEVTLRVTSDDGGTDTRTRNITVDPTTFVDETSTANLGPSPGGGVVLFADIDGDGYLDVIMNDNDYDSEEARLRINDGDNTFTNADEELSPEGGRGGGIGDVDNDGDTDLILGVGQRLHENEDDLEFEISTVGSENNEEALMFVDIDGDGDLDIWSFGEDYMWHENTESGWSSRTTLPGTSDQEVTNGEGATAADINNDGYVDLMFAQSNSDVDAWVNDGDYTYSEPSVGGDLNLPEDVDDHENMEWAWGDYDNDGDMDVYVSGHVSEGLYRNDGTGEFTEVTESAGISESDPDGAAWGDYDNDGYLDLILADSDGNSDLYNNDGDGTFTDVDASANLDADGALGSTVGWFDADNDGDLDLVTNDKTTLWNNTRDDGEYLRVIARGSGNYGGSPVTPIGAQIDVYDDSGSLVGHRELIASQNQHQPPLRQHFGVDPTASYDIRVRFPSGQVVWRNETTPQQETVTVGDTTLEQTVRIEEDGPLFADDFDRPDSNDLAFGWEETEGDADAARVSGTRLDFQAENRDERPVIEHTFPEQTSGTVTFEFTMNFERTDQEQWYSANFQLGDGSVMFDPSYWWEGHDTGVAVNLKWGGDEDEGVSAMTDDEGFGYTLDGDDTQIGIVSGSDGDNEGGDATITVTIDLDANTYDIEVTGPGLVDGSGTASDVPFDNDVNIDTLRIFLDELEQANFGDLEIDDVSIEQGS